MATRADTTSATTPTPETTLPIIDRVFADSVAARMGVRQVSIPFGDRVYPVATAGAAFNWVASEGADLAAAVAYATGDQILSPDHTGGCRIDVTRQAMKQSGARRGYRTALRQDPSRRVTVTAAELFDDEAGSYAAQAALKAGPFDASFVLPLCGVWRLTGSTGPTPATLAPGAIEQAVLRLANYAFERRGEYDDHRGFHDSGAADLLRAYVRL